MTTKTAMNHTDMFRQTAREWLAKPGVFVSPDLRRQLQEPVSSAQMVGASMQLQSMMTEYLVWFRGENSPHRITFSGCEDGAAILSDREA